MKRLEKIRKAVQIAWGLGCNANVTGFLNGKIYTGPLKRFCVPGMNCYSCPGALGACPVGALQSFYTGRKKHFPFYVLGFLMTVGILVGRFVCGWLCLFGLLQELLYEIPVPKLRIPAKVDRMLRNLKYIILMLFVILLPLILHDEMGMSFPAFCKWICPVGMLEGGIPLLILNKGLRPAAHFLYVWKFVLLLLCLLSAVFVHRPFCRYICPLGAFYALFQKISFLQLHFDKSACVDCGACQKTCPMQVDPKTTPNSTECIRCGRCVSDCPVHALRFSVVSRSSNVKEKQKA